MDVEVDEPGEDQPVAGIDDLLARPGREPVAQLDDPLGVQPDVPAGVEPLARVDDGAAPDQHVRAPARPSRPRPAGVIARRS